MLSKMICDSANWITYLTHTHTQFTIIDVCNNLSELNGSILLCAKMKFFSINEIVVIFLSSTKFCTKKIEKFFQTSYNRELNLSKVYLVTLKFEASI